METVLTEKEQEKLDWIMAQGGFEHVIIHDGYLVFMYTWSCNLTRMFLDHGVDVNYRAPSGMTLLMYCTIAYPDSNVPALLLERGADVNLTDHGWTVLDYLLDRVSAPDRCHKNNVLLLMKYGAFTGKTWKPDTLIREFYFTVRSFLVLVNTNFVLPIDVLRVLHAFIIG
jgi:hypothetical protein